ncbi:MAG: N-acetyltransferase [Burkholderiales bacterium]|jgi:predicted GNAT family acetyltransferase|nr:N-acetyltransferase [Burkholderiales bacterium]
MSQTILRHAAASDRYEIVVDDTIAGFAEYTREGGVVTFTHTVIEPAYEGQGLGTQLARFALDDVRANGLRIVPQCSFIRAWVKRHPEALDLVTDEARSRYGL